jgi:hypothetical protein
MTAPVSDLKRRARIALGIAVVALVFLGESVVAHRVAPHPASPWVWTVLGVTGIGALAYALGCALRLRRAAQGGAGSK